MIITNTIEIDLVRRGVTPRLDAVQNDANSRAVEISLLENGAAWTVPDAVSAAISYVKPDGTSGLYDTLPNVMQAVQISGNTIRFTMAPQMLTVPGLVRAAVVLIKNTEQISTFPLDIYVTAQPGAGAVKSENYYYYTTFEALNNAIGLLKELQTTDKSSLVAAVNEVFRKIGTGTGSGGGYSPTVELEETADGVLLRITDINGTQEVFIPNGQPGEDGVSPIIKTTQTADGVVLNIHDVNGTTSVTVPKGQDGISPHIGANGNWHIGNIDTGVKAAGAKGDPGNPPVKGIDYFTDEDKEEMVQYLMDVLKTPVFGRVDAENNIILSGDLAEGTYTFKYEDAEGNLTVIGTLGSSGEDEPVIVNQLPISVGKDGAVYNGKGYKENTRYSASSGEEKTAEGVYLSGYIPVYAGAVVRLKNIRMNKNDTALYVCQLVYCGGLNDNGSSQNMNNTEETVSKAFSPVWDADGNLVQITVPDWGTQYIRLVTGYIGEDSIVTVDQEIPE